MTVCDCCPTCGNEDWSQIEDSGIERDDNGTICYREYECQICGCVWTTHEVVDIIKEGNIESDEGE